MNTQLMQYLNSVFTGIAPCEQAAELHEELLANMQEKCEDLLQEGMAEQEAIAAVIAGIGSPEELLEGLPRTQSAAPFAATATQALPSAPPIPPSGTGDGGTQWRFPSIGITQITVEARTLNCRILVVEDSEFVIRFLSNFGMETLPPLVRQAPQCLYVNAQTQQTRRLFQRRENSGTLEIYLPRSFAGLLQIRSLSGEIQCDSALALAQAQLETLSGKISLAQLRSKIYRLKTISGDISAQLLDGMGTADSLSGSIFADAAQGDVRLDSKSGCVKLLSAQGKVALRSISGDVTIHRCQGDWLLRSTSGSVEAGQMQGFGELRSISGDVSIRELRLAGNLLMTSTSGSVRTAFCGMPDANVQVSTTSGSVRVGNMHHQGRGSFGQSFGQGKYRVEARTVSGDVSLSW